MSESEQITALKHALGRAFALIAAQQVALESAEALVRELRRGSGEGA